MGFTVLGGWLKAIYALKVGFTVLGGWLFLCSVLELIIYLYLVIK